jgi:hypothetical protein
MRKRVRIGLAVVAVIVALSGITLLVTWRAYRHVPEFYSEALDANPAQARQASEEMSSRVTMFYSDVKRQGEWQASFTAQQVNGWLAVDLEEKHAGLLPPHIQEPRVEIDSAALTLALRIRTDNVDTVFSLAVEPYVAEPNTIAFRLKSARAGALPVPMSDVLKYINEAAARMETPLRWTQIEEDPVALWTFTPHRDEDDNLLWLDKIMLADGQIFLSGHTIPPGGSSPTKTDKVWPSRVANEIRQQSKSQN